jgi:opacity protein-like surface antigen
MKKVLQVGALALCVTFMAQSALADNQGAFVSLGGGRSSFNTSKYLTPPRGGLDPRFNTVVDDRRSHAFNLLAGYRWNVAPSLYLGVEGGYASLGAATAKDSETIVLPGVPYTNSYQINRRQKVRAGLLGINVRWELPYHWMLTAHGGAARYRTTYAGSLYDTINGVVAEPVHAKFGHDNDSYYFGVGVGYDVTAHLGVTVAYDIFNPQSLKSGGDRRTYETIRVRALGANVEYRF